jgi:hypothetical protein
MVKFSKNLFWDVDETALDAQEHCRFIIERVLTRGLMADWWTLIGLYDSETIKKEIVQMRYLDKLTLNFCSTFFHIPKTQFRCFNQPQSIQELWQF